jgi:hypothetical protein
MFKVIGGVVVVGMALYGLVKYLERPMVKVVINATPHKHPASEAAVPEAALAAGDPEAEEAAMTESPPATV